MNYPQTPHINAAIDAWDKEVGAGLTEAERKSLHDKILVLCQQNYARGHDKAYDQYATTKEDMGR